MNQTCGPLLGASSSLTTRNPTCSYFGTFSGLAVSRNAGTPSSFAPRSPMSIKARPIPFPRWSARTAMESRNQCGSEGRCSSIQSQYDEPRVPPFVGQDLDHATRLPVVIPIGILGARREPQRRAQRVTRLPEQALLSDDPVGRLEPLDDLLRSGGRTERPQGIRIVRECTPDQRCKLRDPIDRSPRNLDHDVADPTAVVSSPAPIWAPRLRPGAAFQGPRSTSSSRGGPPCSPSNRRSAATPSADNAPYRYVGLLDRTGNKRRPMGFAPGDDFRQPNEIAVVHPRGFHQDAANCTARGSSIDGGIGAR